MNAQGRDPPLRSQPSIPSLLSRGPLPSLRSSLRSQGPIPSLRSQGPLPLGLLLVLVWIAAGAALAWAASPSGIDQIAARNAEANRLYAAGDVAGALGIYRTLQRDRGDIPQLSINAGNALQVLGDLERALPNYEHAASAPDTEVVAVAHYDRGNALFALSRLGQARDAYKAALRAEPLDVAAKFNIEVIELLTTVRADPQRPGDPGGQQGEPGQRGERQAGGQQGQQPEGASSDAQAPKQRAPQEDGPPTSTRLPGDSTADLSGALEEFRETLTLEEALRLLDALRASQPGIQVFIEGNPGRRGLRPLY